MDQTTNFSQINYNIFQQNMNVNPNLFNMNNMNSPILNQMDMGLLKCSNRIKIKIILI